MIRSRNVLALTGVTGSSQKNRATHSRCKFRGRSIPRVVGKPETETGLVADFRVAHHPLAIASGIDEPPVAGIALAEAQRI